MHAQNFVVNESSNWHAVKNVLKFFPKSDTVPVLALVIEAVNAINLTALVVTSEQEEVFLELDFVGQQQNYSFKRLFAASNLSPKLRSRLVVKELIVNMVTGCISGINSP